MGGIGPQCWSVEQQPESAEQMRNSGRALELRRIYFPCEGVYKLFSDGLGPGATISKSR
jgi:hypothetical protein